MKSPNIEEPTPAATISERVRYLMKLRGLTQLQFARLIGYDHTNVSKILTGRLSVTQGFINSVVANMGVSKRWLVDGQGVPFPRENEPVEIDSTAIVAHQRPKGTPVYDIDVTAGRSELAEMFTDDRILGYVDLPNMDPQSCLVRVSGDSMTPAVKNGGMVCVKPISDPSIIFWGQMYVVILKDYRMVKYVRRHPDPDLVILHSANPDYDDIEVRRSDIHRLFLVEAVLNYEIRC